MPLPWKKIIQKNFKHIHREITKTSFQKIIRDPNNPLIIEVKDLEKWYGTNHVTKKISFGVKNKERIAIIGANGAGKTTLVEIIAGIRQPSNGTVTYNFKQSRKNPNYNIGFQFQEATYPRNLSISDLLIFYREIFTTTLETSKIKRLVKILDLIDNVRKPIDRLSGGQKQRLNILLALMHNPEMLILDEISTGLDIETREEIQGYIKDLILQNNQTLLFISHNLDEINYLCERAIILDDGKIYHDDTITNYKRNFGSLNKYVYDFFAQRRKRKIAYEAKIEEQLKSE